MKGLEKNIKYYMQLKGYKKNTDLLRAIARELQYSDKKVVDAFVKSEKGNFSKMLKGERPLKYDFIIPLEKIFGVSLARMLDEDAYKLPIEKEEVPFDKGFRYYAYLDDMELYKKYLKPKSDSKANSILENLDEFEKTFLDYVVEYNAVNGVRFLKECYDIKLRVFNNQFSTNEGVCFWLHNKPIQFCRLVASMQDTQLFNEIYDPYYMFSIHGGYISDSIFMQDDFFEILMDYDNLFQSLFEEKKYDYTLPKTKEEGTFISINPLLNPCLEFVLKHLDKYRKQAIEILNFGIKHNIQIMKEIDTNEILFLDDLGGIRKNYNHPIINIAVFTEDKNIKDQEIKKRIEELRAPLLPILKWRMK